jgi:hypothetical protein
LAINENKVLSTLPDEIANLKQDLDLRLYNNPALVTTGNAPWQTWLDEKVPTWRPQN